MIEALRAAAARVRELLRSRTRHAAEQDDEFAFHIAMETAENVRRGMTEPDARRAALLRFGGAERFREETRDARGIVAVDNLLRDARFALRRIRRAPAFATGVIATLGVGIGAAVGIGTLVYGVLLRDLPYDHPDRLVRVGFHTDGVAAQGDQHSPATYLHFAKSAQSFSALGAFTTNDGFNLTDGETPERVAVAMVTPNTFTLLGARPLLGQLFEPGDTSWSGPRAPIVISEELWRRRYGADPDIIGRRIDVNRGARIVVGVLPRAFDFPSPSISVWYPAAIPVNRPQITARAFAVVGRLRDGTDRSAAEAELNALIPALTERFPAITPEVLERSRARVSVQSLREATVAPVRPQLVLLGVLVAVVLLIATTNVVNLFLLRTEVASHEIAIALSLGASRIALAQRFVIEGLVLGLVSATVAIPAAALAVSTKFGFTEREIPRLHEIAFGLDTVAVVLACAALIGACVGLIAVTRTGMTDIFDRLRSTRSTSGRGWRRAQDGLVAFQVALALMLLVASGLLGRSFWNLRNANIGFAPAQAMSFEVSLPWNAYRTYAENAAFHERLMQRLAALPGVASVAAASHLPLDGRGTPVPEWQVRGAGDADAPTVEAIANMASPDYFRTMGIPLRAGRAFRPGDLRGTPAVMVSERLATVLFGTTDVVGRAITRSVRGETTFDYRIVGVVGDVHLERIEDGYAPMAYVPLLPDGDGLPADSFPVQWEPRDVAFAIRGTQLPPAPAIEAIVKALDRRVPATDIRMLDARVDDATARVRLTLVLIAVAGGAALLLGVIGVYSVVSYAATARVREFGIRLALGAAPARVRHMVLGDGLRLVTMGTVAGLAAALVAAKFLRALLYEVAPTSVAEFAMATCVLIAATLVASALPARRAARTDPAAVLRSE